MAVPSTRSQLSTTEASNAPTEGGSDTIPDLNNYMRNIYRFLAEDDASATIASGSTVDLSTTDKRIILVTGTTTTTSFGNVAADVWRVLIPSGSPWTITHNGSTLICPNGVNLVLHAGDAILLRSLGSSSWAVVNVFRRTTPTFAVYSTLGSVATTSATEFTSYSEVTDRLSHFASGRFTCVIPGDYHFSYVVETNKDSVDTSCSVELRKNGSSLTNITKTFTNISSANSIDIRGAGVTIPLVAADYVSLFTTIGSVSGVNMSIRSFTGHLIST